MVLTTESISTIQNSKEPRVYSLGDLVDDACKDAERRHTARINGQPFGVSTPWPQLTELLGGSLAPGLHTLNAGAGVGKTAFALQIAAACQCPAIYVSAEMNRLELIKRITANLTSTFLNRIKRGEFPPDQLRQLILNAATKAPQFILVDATDVYASPEYLERITKAAIDKAGSQFGLVIIDSIHAWVESNTESDASEHESLNDGIRKLRVLADRLGIPILGIAERNMAAYAKGANKDRVVSGAGTRKFANAAETVIALDNIEGELESPSGDWRVTVKLEKNRHGKKGEITLKFNGDLQRFEDQ